MRLRNITGSNEIIAENEFVIHEEQTFRGNWNSQVFQNENPVEIEIGMGKGQFLTALAASHPQINYIGIEKYSSVLLRAIQKQEELRLSNLYFIRMDAEEIEQVFGPEEISRIYLNFSDPWPKDRHAKRRLTSKEFLSRYDKFLKENGTIEFKTDNDSLFAFSLEEIPAAGWKIKARTFDLHHTPGMLEGNVMTEYEEKFSSLGNPIHKLIAYR